VLLVFAALSAHSQQQMVGRHGRVAMYAVTMGWEWLLLGYVVWGARRKGVGLREIVGGRWASPEDALLDLAIAVGFWITAALLLAGLSFALGLTHADQLQQAKKQLGELLPRSRTELELWLALSATAGFCEEVLFRGYLQKQFTAATRRAWMGLALQAVLFGIAHAYQGERRIVLIGCYGAMFGGLALWRKSLRPGMMAHALQDSLSGLLFRFMK
jgi:membrane protease YdiL (CAAX protease family)